jgi:hypothetical protein
MTSFFKLEGSWLKIIAGLEPSLNERLSLTLGGAFCRFLDSLLRTSILLSLFASVGKRFLIP